MGARLVAGFVGLVILVIFVQSVLLGDDDQPTEGPASADAAPTATLPPQLPEPLLLGESAGESTNPTAGGSPGGTYVVESGDTLGSIASEMGIPAEAQSDWIQEVLSLNEIADARLIQVGQELQIPGTGSAPAPEGTPTPAPESEEPEAPSAEGDATDEETDDAVEEDEDTAPSGSGATYTVVTGDTPLDIAEKHCVEGSDAWVAELLALNNTDEGSLNVGQELQLPADTPGCEPN